MLHEGPGLQTISKTRILSEGQQQLLRLDRDGDRAAFAAAAGDLLGRILPLLDEQAAVVLADYEKGAISPAVARAVIDGCRSRGIPCVVDPKKVDFTAYARATVVTPNLLEAERAAGRPLPDDAAVARAADAMRVALELDAMLITRGAEGMTLSTPRGITHIPAQVRDVADVTGAGDTVVAVLAACLGSGWDLVEACRLANVAAGIAVSHPGTYVVHADELAMAWKGLSHKILNRESARRRLAEARRRGRKVVFTNGCFDILHAGHLACLEGAKRLGDLLVVGLNSDASVRGLKGDSRPVIGQENRASLLAGLACVDVVVIFDEPTPEALIRAARARRAGQGRRLHAGPDRRRRHRPGPRRAGRHPPPGPGAEHDRHPRAEGRGCRSDLPRMTRDDRSTITFSMGVTLAVLAALLYGLVKDKPADLLFVGAVVLLAAFGVISPEEAFAGFANSGMLIVAAMFVVAAGLRETGRDGIRRRALPRPRRDRGAGPVLHGGRADPLGHGAEQHAQGRPAGAGADRLVPQAADLPLAAADAAVVPVDPGRAPAR